MEGCYWEFWANVDMGNRKFVIYRRSQFRLLPEITEILMLSFEGSKGRIVYKCLRKIACRNRVIFLLSLNRT